MATATNKLNRTQTIPRGRPRSGAAPLQFLVYVDNGGDYRWEIVGEGGKRLAQSRSFGSRADAEREARRVHAGAGSAEFQANAAEVHQPAAV